MIVTLGSIRGSPGVTSWALLLAAAWPAEHDVERIVLEADPAGGVLGARYGWGVSPGLVSLAAALRRNGDGGGAILDHSRSIAPDVSVVPAPESGEQARTVLTASVGDLANRLAPHWSVWLVDAGRLDEANPSTALVSASAATVLLCGGRSEDLVAVPARVEALRRRNARWIGVLVSGRCAFGRSEVAGFTGADQTWLAGGAADDLSDAAASVLAGRWRARRSLVWREAVEIASDVAVASAPAPVESGAPS